MRSENKTYTYLLFAMAILFFGFVCYRASLWLNARDMDFSIYWQAGHMNLSGGYVYDSQDWDLERANNSIRPSIEAWFHYPLPFAIILTPLGLLPIENAFIIWMFFSQYAILLSLILLLGFDKKLTPISSLLFITSIFLFRPVYIVILSGQIDAYLLLFVSLSLYLTKKEQWYLSGFVLSLVSFKPSIGITILALTSIWFFFGRRWSAIAGVISGCLTLLFIGLAQRPSWVLDYLSIGQQVFSKYNYIQTTIWGLSKLLIENEKARMVISLLAVLGILSIEIYYLAKNRFNTYAFFAIATTIPVALLIAPYSWSYDQILLIVPILYLALKIAQRWGPIRAIIFLICFDLFTISFLAIAYLQGHDIWSSMIAIVIWVATLFLIKRQDQLNM